MRLHFRELGQGPPLIMLHGLFGSLDNWAPVSQRLARQFRVLAVDQRNHGQSPHSPEMNYRTLAGDLLEFLQQHNLPSVHVLGHSMGGKVAMEFALLHPEKVNRLIVVDMAPRAYSRKHDAIFAALLGLDPSKFATRGQVEEALAPGIPEPALRRFFLKGLANNPGGGFTWKFNLRVLHESYEALGEALVSDHPFRGPTLFVRGGKSDYIRDPDLAGIRQLFASAQMLTIPNASHWVHAEAAETFTEALINWLSLPMHDNPSAIPA